MVKFVLKDPSTEDLTLIYLIYNFDGQRLKMSTGEKIHPDNWSKSKCRAKPTSPHSVVLNKLLDRMEARVRECHIDLKSNFTTITSETLRKAVDVRIKNKGKRETFIEFIDRFISESSAYRKLGSMEVYRSTVKLLNNYSAPKNFDDIGPEWFAKYQAYMEQHNYSANYIGKNVAIIRELMTIARKQGLTNNTAYKDNTYRKPSEEVDSIYLTENELLMMYGIELPDYLDKVCTRFMIGAFTGLRFSDSAKITHESIRQGLIFDRNIKTGGDVVIPIHWVVQQIMDQHPEGLPPAISNQKANVYLKEIGQRAGIDDVIQLNKTIGGKITSNSHKKYKLITTHTGRRSAATNMFLAGIPSISIMKITGHKTERAFMKYIRISTEENARLMQAHPFFQLDQPIIPN